MTTCLSIRLAAAALTLAVAATPAAAEPAASSRGLDCRFFDSQAFNREEAHYTTAMARMCRLLSEYKEAVVANAMAQFHEDRAARDYARPRRIERLSTTSDVGNYLIAREIGLIEALAAMERLD